MTHDPDDAEGGPSHDDDAPVEVPAERLSAAALRGLVQEFVTRDGTDYGAREAALERKIDDVLRQIERGEVRVVFDPATRSANLIRAADLQRALAARRGMPRR
ncbi:MAG: YheU family protein [Thermodesulfobacteriota bacterium]